MEINANYLRMKEDLYFAAYDHSQTNLFGQYTNVNMRYNYKMGTVLKKFRAGQITATVWENTKKIDGREDTFHSVSIEKNYKDSKDEWQTTNSFNVNDLPRVALVSEQAFEFLVLKNIELEKQ